jgi:heterodisulfide reductase subunit B2
MKQIAYFPGCAMKDQAAAYEAGARVALAALGWELAELPRWNCCGTVYSLSEDDLMRHVGPVRNFVRTQEQGEERLLTLCAMCYGTLARSARFVQSGDRLARINAFMDDEADYSGGVKVIHLLDLLRGDVGYAAIESRVVRSLAGLKVAPYYGCTLLRPREVGVDDVDRPEVMERVLAALGAEPVAYAEATECCGAYLTAISPDVVEGRAGRILGSACAAGADLVVTSCPLCQFNLTEHRPRATAALPMVYLGEILAWALVPTAEVPADLRALLQTETTMGVSA